MIDVPVCVLCNHTMDRNSCGFSVVIESKEFLPLCNHDTHSCYRAWYIYEKRPA